MIQWKNAMDFIDEVAAAASLSPSDFSSLSEISKRFTEILTEFLVGNQFEGTMHFPLLNTVINNIEVKGYPICGLISDPVLSDEGFEDRFDIKHNALEFSSKIDLVFDPGAFLRLVRRNGIRYVYVYIRGTVHAGLTKVFHIFDYEPKHATPPDVIGLVFGPASNERIYPQWWGATGNGTGWPADRLTDVDREPGDVRPLDLQPGETVTVDSLGIQQCINAAGLSHIDGQRYFNGTFRGTSNAPSSILR